MMSDYKAFISYSHADAATAAWLHRALETYRVSSRLLHQSADRRIGRIFRDRSELPAGSNLSQSVSEALAASEYLIVLCSPDAARSTWVNQEIAEFRRLHGEERILCLIVRGEPLSGDVETECFPPALGYQSSIDGHEPVAADLRAGGDGRRLAMLKIVAGLLHIGLDDLVQRDTQRRIRQLTGISVGSVMGMILLAVLSLLAIEARRDEETRRAEAEALIEFMLSDLRVRLEAVGRLDVLSAVGEKTIAYYASDDLEALADSSLGRRARAFHVLGEVSDLKGELEAAGAAFDEAYATTRELVRRTPDDGDRVFEHAQSVFWVGYLNWHIGAYEEARRHLLEYVQLTERLVEIDPDRSDWLAELGSAQINVGVYELETGEPTAAATRFMSGVSIYEKVVASDPEVTERQMTLAGARAWLADAQIRLFRLDEALANRLAEIEVYQAILAREPRNKDVNLSLLNAHEARAEILLSLGDVEDALRNIRTAKGYADELLVLEPENTLIQREACELYVLLADTLSHAGRYDQVPAILEHAATLSDALLRQDGQVLGWNWLRHAVRIAEGKHLLRIGRPADASELLAATSAELKRLSQETPESTELRYLLGETNYHLGRSLNADRQVELAQNSFRSAVNGLSPDAQKLSPHRTGILAMAYQALGENRQALEVASRLTAIGYQHPQYLNPQGAVIRSSDYSGDL